MLGAERSRQGCCNPLDQRGLQNSSQMLNLFSISGKSRPKPSTEGVDDDRLKQEQVNTNGDAVARAHVGVGATRPSKGFAVVEGGSETLLGEEVRALFSCRVAAREV